MTRPVLFVTNYVPPARVGAFAALAERVPVEFALFGGRVHHGAAGLGEGEGLAEAPGRLAPGDLPFPARRVSQAGARALAASGRYRAVVAGTVGRTALPAAYLGARRGGVPFVLWATLWAQPKGPAGLAGYPVMRWIYSHADAVVTYGPHVSAYVRARGAREVREAPQAVDAEFWSREPGPEAVASARRAPFQALFTGRLLREKGVRVLLSAWRMTGFEAPHAALVLAGRGPERARAAAAGATVTGELTAAEVRNFYAGSDVVVVPSIPTLAFREPWGMVVNEAMSQGLPVIATDAVGAAAGGLVQDGRNGVVVPAGDAGALAGAIRRLHDDPAERARLGAAGRADVRAYTHAAWADAVVAALSAAGAPVGKD
jgi:glycosyltransferase involved in cell wall biosynthesis